jgi:hypothetical protein
MQAYDMSTGNLKDYVVEDGAFRGGLQRTYRSQNINICLLGRVFAAHLPHESGLTGSV